MEAYCLQENLTKGLAIISRAVASKSTLPVLANVLLETADDQLKLAATDLELSISCWIGAKIAGEGAITVPGKLLTDFVNALPSERVDMKLDEATQTLSLACGRYQTHIKGIMAEEFPILPALPAMEGQILEVDIFRQMIDQVVFAASSDDSRPILTGVLLQFGEGQLTMAAADGFRLSVRQQNSMTEAEAGEVIVPARALQELRRIGSDFEGEQVRMLLDPAAKRVQFVFNNQVQLVSQVIEGNFPDYTQIVPKAHTTSAILDRGDFLKSARLAHLFARETANLVILEIKPAENELTPGQVVMQAQSAELGDNTAYLEARITGEGHLVAFNARYLIDVLAAIDAPQVMLKTGGPAAPGVFEIPGENGNYQHVIMPMHAKGKES